MAEGSVWADPEKSRQAVQEIKELKRWVDPYHAVRKRIDDARALLELAEGESDEEHARLVAEMLKGRSLEQEAEGIAAQLEALELQNMLRGSDDTRDALLTIHSGAGGTESQDWAEMLMRMYTRWAERHGFKVEVLDLLQGEEAGIKSAEIQISGQYAYGLLKAENRRVPCFGEGRAARQQDVVGGADHASPDQHRRAMPERAQPIQEQGDGAQDAESAVVRARRRGA